MPPLKVAINAQIPPGHSAGGTEQALLGLVAALGKLVDDDEYYVLVTHPAAPSWLDPYLGPNQRVVVAPWSSRIDTIAASLPKWLRRTLGPAWRQIRQMLGRRETIPLPDLQTSDGFFESLGVDVIHFPYQSMVLSSIPSIFNPWDLQHLHHPEFFPPDYYSWREMAYRTWCNHARAVVSPSWFTRQDLLKQYQIDPEKVFVIPAAAPIEQIELDPELPSRVQQELELPKHFVFYPAHTWPHKNHLRLLEAMALLRDKYSLEINLICSGLQIGHWSRVAKRRAELDLEKQIQFVGFLPFEQVRALYRLADFVIIPSLFEGFGLPVLEAFTEGVPVASSSLTSLPEVAGDAALLFDPYSVGSIAQALWRMSTDEGLRLSLREQGILRVKAFTWERTARMYRALYREIAGRPLSSEDRALLSQAQSEPDKGTPEGT